MKKFFSDNTFVFIVSLVIVILILVAVNSAVGFIVKLIKQKTNLGGTLTTNAINVIGTKTTYYPLGTDYGIASSTIDVEGLDSGTFYVGFDALTSTGGAMALKVEYSPNNVDFFGLNSVASSTNVYASTTLVKTNGLEYLYILPLTTTSGSTTIPVSFKDIAVKSLRVSIKKSDSLTNGNVWVMFQGKQKD